MSESPAPIEIQQAKKNLLDRRTISKNNDQEGRENLASQLREKRRERDALHQDIATTQTELDDRQSNLLVKLKTKLNIPDKQIQELEATKLEHGMKDESLSDTRKMVEAYYEKVAETPLTNQEKRDLLKPEALAQLSTDEYVALWKRLNPQYLSHVTKQGFCDHDVMVYHFGEPARLHTDFTDIAKDEKCIRPKLALNFFRKRDYASVKTAMEELVFPNARNEAEAMINFDRILHWSIQKDIAPAYADHTSVHFASMIIPEDYYGAETGNDIFFIFPTDVLASQYDFAFNGRYKDLTTIANTKEWNDVFVWPNSIDDPGVSLDAGFVFLPENTQVDPLTGSKYATEIKLIDGKEVRVVVEDTQLVDKFLEWSRDLHKNIQLLRLAQQYFVNRDEKADDELGRIFKHELLQLGFTEDAVSDLIPNLKRDFILWGKDATKETYRKLVLGSSSKFKRAENTISAKEYWERYFTKYPDLKPKHIVYYDGDPTTAIYQFQRKNGIGKTDTSNYDGQFLGFEDHHVTDMTNDPRANMGHQELVSLGNRIIKEHYSSTYLKK